MKNDQKHQKVTGGKMLESLNLLNLFQFFKKLLTSSVFFFFFFFKTIKRF